MRVLLDECMPARFAHGLSGHNDRTVRQLGWTGTKNGALLAQMASAGIDVFITVDQSIPNQNNLKALGVAIVILRARRNRLKELLPLAPDVLQALTTIQPGDVVIIPS